MKTAAAGDHFVVRDRDDLHPRQPKLILRMLGNAFGHNHTTGRDRERVDDGGVVFMVDFNASDSKRVEPFKKPKRQQRDAGQREVWREHHEESVNVKTVAGQGHFQEFDALRSQDLLNLTGALLVHS